MIKKRGGVGLKYASSKKGEGVVGEKDYK